MNRLFIAEKPSVAKAIASVLGIVKSDKGFVKTKSGDYVTWCFGHLMELEEPDAYLPDHIPTSSSGKKIWRESDLPIIPTDWKLKVKSDCKAQFSTIKKLAQGKDIATIVNCGDPDREGQLLVDEVLSFFGNKKPVLRYWAAAVDDATVKKAVTNLKNNSAYLGMKNAALARSHADWLIGMNATRAFTLASGRGGNRALLSVGRVQTPTLNLVASRDEKIKNFKPQTYYVFKGQFKAKGKIFTATLQFSESQPGLDQEQHLIDANAAKSLLAKLKTASAAVVSAFSSKEKEKSPPLVYSLADIQSEGNAKYGYSAEKVLNICQALYEKHKLTTYPRSDCQYLPTVQHAEAPKVLSALKSFHNELIKIISCATPGLKSKVWNDSKISAHHGIIPTQQKGDLSELSADEKNIYYLIVKRYLAQFYKSAKLLATQIKLNVKNELFICNGSVILDPGYLAVFGDIENEEKDESSADEEEQQSLPLLREGESVEIIKIEPVTAQTKPPAYFTEGTLIKAMQNIYSCIDNPSYKKILKDGDGIGTSATRAGIIAELRKKELLITKGKKLMASDKAFALLKELPDLVKNPMLTAMFESQLKLIEEGKISIKQFEDKQISFTKDLVNTAASLTIKLPSSVTSATASSGTTFNKKTNSAKKFVKKTRKR